MHTCLLAFIRNCLSFAVDCGDRFIRCTELLCDYLTDQYPITTGDAEFHVIPSCDLHVTISRTVAIRHHWIEPLMSRLRNGLAKHQRCVRVSMYVYCVPRGFVHTESKNLCSAQVFQFYWIGMTVKTVATGFVLLCLCVCLV